jgi:hypothetical protein
MMSGMSWSGRPVPSAALRLLILLPGGIPGVRFDYGSVAITGTPKPAVAWSRPSPAFDNTPAESGGMFPHGNSEKVGYAPRLFVHCNPPMLSLPHVLSLDVVEDVICTED